jgi:hypothetical protein
MTAWSTPPLDDGDAEIKFKAGEEVQKKQGKMLTRCLCSDCFVIQNNEGMLVMYPETSKGQNRSQLSNIY